MTASDIQLRLEVSSQTCIACKVLREQINVHQMKRRKGDGDQDLVRAGLKDRLEEAEAHLARCPAEGLL